MSRELARRARVAQGLLRGESFSMISQEIGTSIREVESVANLLTQEWARTEIETVDAWKRHLFGQLEDLKSELFRRYSGIYDETESGVITQHTEYTDSRGTTHTIVRKPTKLELAALQEIRAIVADQRKLLGLDAPAQSRSVHVNLSPEYLQSLSDEELESLLEAFNIVPESREIAPSPEMKTIDAESADSGNSSPREGASTSS